MRRKLFCDQTFLQPTNARRTDTHTDTNTQGRIHTHKPRLSRLCSLLLVPRSVSLSVGRPLFWCLLPAPSSLSLPVLPQPVYVCVGRGGVLSVVSKCIHCARMCCCHVLSYYSRERRANPVGIVLSCVCCSRSRCCALFCNQTFLQPTNARRTDTHTRIHTPQDGYTHTHTSPLSLVLSTAGAS